MTTITALNEFKIAVANNDHETAHACLDCLRGCYALTEALQFCDIIENTEMLGTEYALLSDVRGRTLDKWHRACESVRNAATTYIHMRETFSNHSEADKVRRWVAEAPDRTHGWFHIETYLLDQMEKSANGLGRPAGLLPNGQPYWEASIPR